MRKQTSSAPVSKAALLAGSALRLCHLLGSLAIAVLLLLLLTIVLLWAVKVEMDYGKYGMRISQFTIYHSAWFCALLALLGINVLCSMLCRLPWKKRHLPFLTSHFGIIVLLLGCFATWQWGEEAQLMLFEGKATDKALKNEQQFEIRSISMTAADLEAGSAGGSTMSAPFTPGPFSWSDYRRENWFAQCRAIYSLPLWLAARIAPRDTRLKITSENGPVESGLTLEVLDYLGHVRLDPPLPLDLSIRFQRPLPQSPASGAPASPRAWESASLLPGVDPMGMHRSGSRSRQTLAGGERLLFYVTDTPAEVEAFRESQPRELAQAGEFGQVVLSLRGKIYYLNVRDLAAPAGREERIPLGDSGYTLSQVVHDARGVVRFMLHAPNGRREQVILFAEMPEQNFQARQLGCFGTYWIAVPDPPEVGETSRPSPRIDLLQGPGRTLYYRYWTGRKLLASGEIVTEEKRSNDPNVTPYRTGEVTLAPGTPDAVSVAIDKFYPTDLPGRRFSVLPLNDQTPPSTERLVRLKAQIDGRAEEFWLRGIPLGMYEDQFAPDQVKYLYGKDRTVRIVWNQQVLNLGFGIYLKKAEEHKEPGIRMAAQYSSLVDQIRLPRDGVARFNDPATFEYLKKDVLIRMNQPGIFHATGRWRTYRLYQSTMSGPFHPNVPDFFSVYDGRPIGDEAKPRESIFLSGLSVNYDPGRGLKYLGCFLLIFGIAWQLSRKKSVVG